MYMSTFLPYLFLFLTVQTWSKYHNLFHVLSEAKKNQILAATALRSIDWIHLFLITIKIYKYFSNSLATLN